MSRLKQYQELIKNNYREDYNSMQEKSKMIVEEFKGKYKELLIYIFITLLIFSLGKNIVDFIRESFVNNITSAFTTKLTNDILFIGVFFLSLIYVFIIKFYDKDLFPSLISSIRLVLIVALYFVCIRPYCYFGERHLSFFNYIYYLDLVWLSAAILTLRLKPYKTLQVNSSDFSLIEDYFNHKISEDELARKPFAENIAKHINGTKNQKAFSIAVIGNWGSGKTTFMNFIEEDLKKLNPNVNLTIKYNPWRVTKTKIMIEDFFQSFIVAINEFDDDLSSKIKSYSNYLLDLDDSIISKFTSLSVNLAVKDSGNADTIIKAYNDINELIRNTGKRFVIFIDDVDRLTGKEILQVIKIIRNTADFNNVFFIVGIDYNYVVQALIKTHEIPNSQSYLQKIFQLEIILPPFDQKKILPRLKIYLDYNNLSPDEKQRFDLVFDQLTDNSIIFSHRIFEGKTRGLIEQSFTSFRDIVRFSNSFKISYRILNGHVDLIDLFLIEIIKIKYPVIYMKIATKELITYSHKLFEANGINGNTIDKEKLTKLLEKEYKYLLKDKDTIVDITDALYSLDFQVLKSFRSIIHPENHIKYFSFSLFENSISISDWQRVKDMSLENMLLQTREWVSENKEVILNEILKEYTDYKDKNEFDKFIRLKLVLSLENWQTEIHK